VRLDPAEVPVLPLAAALVDEWRQVIASTPEWRGTQPGTLAYHAGPARLLISPDEPAHAEQSALMRRLLDEMAAAVRSVPPAQALQATVLTSALELVAGWPRESVGTTGQVLELAEAAVRARVPEARIQVAADPMPQEVPAPAQAALAMVQFATNAARHDGATELRLRVGLGPSFFVEWPSSRTTSVAVPARSHPQLRRRWGLGYVRMVADFLGATALPPGPTAPGWFGACLSLGSRRLTLPLALFADGARQRCTQTWEQEVSSGEPEVQARVTADLPAVVAAARARPGSRARGQLFAGRHVGGRTWIALPPAAGGERVRDVLRGLDHERPLWSAPEPHATRVHALIALLGRALGTPLPAFAPDAFARELPRACAALGIPAPRPGPMLVCPDPRVTAFLLADLGGTLVSDPTGAWVQAPPITWGQTLVRLLGDAQGRIRLTG
jgi:hypothetical protein